MATLQFIEKQYFEDLFDMSSGYVLDFSNRTFQEFIYDTIGIDIYKKYTNLSKAKILRSIINDFDNTTVGKLLLELLRYMQDRNMVESKDKDTFNKCADICKRLIGKRTTFKENKNTPNQQNKVETIDYKKYLEDLQSLTDYSDTPQSRGFKFEKYLKNLFDEFKLEPRGSFKIEGEQIDGSFILNNNVYLLEAKWTNKEINKSDLVIFSEKVSSKSPFTRGIFISFSGFTRESIDTFSKGRKVNIVLMTVQELYIALSRELDLREILSFKVRALCEEGNFNKSVFEM